MEDEIEKMRLPELIEVYKKAKNVSDMAWRMMSGSPETGIALGNAHVKLFQALEAYEMEQIQDGSRWRKNWLVEFGLNILI